MARVVEDSDGKIDETWALWILRGGNRTAGAFHSSETASHEMVLCSSEESGQNSLAAHGRVIAADASLWLVRRVTGSGVLG